MPFLDKNGLAHLWNHIIARLNGKADKEDLKQSDWNQADVNQLDYIKNKPQELSDEELLMWLNDAEVVSPVASTSGEIYTTNNNEIYVL